jgi:hypothetical protein
MSNLCSNYVEIIGNDAAIRALSDKIDAIYAITDRKKLNEDNWYLCDAHTLHCDYGMSNLQKNSDTEITFNICSRNSPPTANLYALSKEIPTLTITCLYEEPGMQLYGRLQYTEGSCIEDAVFTEEQWLEEHDDDYKFEKKNIAELPYDKFLDEYSKWNDEGELDDECKYRYLGKDIVARIKDDDLPLFINVEWNDDDAEQQYKERYSQVKEPTDE